MRFKTLLAALLVAALTVSAAVASPPPGKGKGQGKREAATQTSLQQHECKLTGGLNLKGTYVSSTVAADGTGTFALQVTKANKHGKVFNGLQASVAVDAKTKYRPKKYAKFANVPAGAKLLVQSRVCKRTSSSTPPQLLARMVVVQIPSGGDEEAGASTSTSTSTSTATTTTESTSTAATTTTTP